MKSNERKATFEAAMTLAHHREQLEQKCAEIERLLAGRNQPLLPEKWTDEDAWALAGALTECMAQMNRVRHTVFDKDNPYPEEDTLLEDIPYYNPYAGPYVDENPYKAPELPLELWKEVLHCGILIAASKPDFCFPSQGTFGDLEELFRGVLRSGGGPKLQLDYVLDQLGAALAEGRFEELETWDFDALPPRFDPPEDDLEESRQQHVQMVWEEWNWLSRFPYKDALSQALARLGSEALFTDAMNFIHYEIGLNDGLGLAIDLYLHQTGKSGMAEDSYYVTYAMLCRTQKQMEKAMAVPRQETEG